MSTISLSRSRFTALLARALGLRSGDLVVFELPEKATYADLMAAIGERFADQLPPNTWDSAQNRFHAHVRGLQNGYPLNDPAAILEPRHGSNVSLVGIAGG